MKDLHKKDVALFQSVVFWMTGYARIFKLPLRAVRPLEKEKCSRYFGRCSKKGNIHIRVRDVKGGKWAGRDEVYQIIDSMSHELAHLRQQKHNGEWFHCHTVILERMARDGIYDLLRKL